VILSTWLSSPVTQAKNRVSSVPQDYKVLQKYCRITSKKKVMLKRNTMKTGRITLEIFKGRTMKKTVFWDKVLCSVSGGLPIFQRNVWAPCAGPNNKPRKKQAAVRAGFAWLLKYQWSLLTTWNYTLKKVLINDNIFVIIFMKKIFMISAGIRISYSVFHMKKKWSVK
jgi:hypothetical protein